MDRNRYIYVIDRMRNTPPNLVRWLRDPQTVVPGNAMPNMHIDELDARDVAAYLYTLRWTVTTEDGNPGDQVRGVAA